MTCHLTSDPRECMLRHAHARLHHDGVGCLRCATGISRMSRPVEWPVGTDTATPERPQIMSKKRKSPASAQADPAQSKRRGQPRKVQDASSPTIPTQPKRRGRPRKCRGEKSFAAAPTPAPVTPDAVRLALAEALPLAEACAVGVAYLAGRCAADPGRVREILEAEGLKIFQNELAFQGHVQPCVSVNKRLRAWVAA